MLSSVFVNICSTPCTYSSLLVLLKNRVNGACSSVVCLTLSVEARFRGQHSSNRKVQTQANTVPVSQQTPTVLQAASEQQLGRGRLIKLTLQQLTQDIPDCADGGPGTLLLAVKSGIDNWVDFSSDNRFQGWNSLPVCSWTGITCDAQGLVTEM